MKAISLWQPWASLWLSPAKIHETRHWKTAYRGQLAVHASQTKKHYDAIAPDLDDICRRYFGADWRKTLPRGALLGYVALIDCEPVDGTSIGRGYAMEDWLCGDFSAGRFAWKRTPEWRL